MPPPLLVAKPLLALLIAAIARLVEEGAEPPHPLPSPHLLASPLPPIPSPRPAGGGSRRRRHRHRDLLVVESPPSPGEGGVEPPPSFPSSSWVMLPLLVVELPPSPGEGGRHVTRVYREGRERERGEEEGNDWWRG